MIGSVLLYSTFLVNVLAIILVILNKNKIAKYLVRISFFLLVATTLLLAYYFVTSDFRFLYVWQYSEKNLSFWYKLSGLWAGQEGTYLIWAIVVLASALWYAEKFNLEDRVASTIVLLTSALLIGLALLTNPFKTFLQFFEEQAKNFAVPLSNVIHFYEQQYGMPFMGDRFPDGNGLNPLLKDPWMAVHPPVVFIGYGTLALPFAMAISYLWSRYQRWLDVSLFWIRISWLFLTLGIAIGGYWAYKVLGWGGFWAWDPVETASLIPWLTLTAFLHAFHRRYDNLSLLLISVSYAFIFYATFITRSGIWESVHAFAETVAGFWLALAILNSVIIPSILIGERIFKGYNDVSKKVAFSIFLSQVIFITYRILIQDFSMMKLYEFIALAVLSIGIFLGVLRSDKIKRVADEIKKEEKRKEYVEINIFSSATMFTITIILLSVLAFVSFWGLTQPIIIQAYSGEKIKVTPEFFNTWSYPFTYMLIIILVLCLSYRYNKKLSKILTVSSFAFSILLAFILKSYELLIVGASIFAAFASVLVMPRGYIYLSHLGVALILIGAILSTTLDEEKRIFFNYDFEKGIEKSVKPINDKYGIKIESMRIFPNEKGYMTTELLVTIYKNGKEIGSGTTGIVNDLKWGRVFKVYIENDFLSSIYVVFEGIGAHGYESEGITIPITVIIHPYVVLLWLGIILLSIGILPRILNKE